MTELSTAQIHEGYERRSGQEFMCTNERDELLSSISETIADYRRGEIDPPTPGHVDHWVRQFEAPVQVPILAELRHVLQQTYFPKSKVEEFLSGLLKPCKLVGENPKEFWQTCGLLDIQQRGHSQKDMLAAFDVLLQRECGISVANCSSTSGNFVYLDDAQFSGYHVINDVRTWLNQAPEQIRLIILSIVQHSGSMPFVRERLSQVATELGKRLVIEGWRCIEIENRRIARNQSEILWPARLPDDPLVMAYSQALSTAGYPPVLRSSGAMGNSRFFSSEEGRDLLEQEFLKAGVRIRAEAPNLHEYQRPMGNTILKTVGFGSLVVTYRNCPNNNPLAFWASEPWYPLFPRKTN
jgi:hypothetical protein